MELLKGLLNTQAQQVHCSFEQVADIVGVELAEELALSKTSLTQAKVKSRNLVQAQKEAVRAKKIGATMAAFEREELVNAIKKALGYAEVEISGGREDDRSDLPEGDEDVS